MVNGVVCAKVSPAAFTCQMKLWHKPLMLSTPIQKNKQRTKIVWFALAGPTSARNIWLKIRESKAKLEIIEFSRPLYALAKE
jgi:hypothetical protein